MRIKTLEIDQIIDDMSINPRDEMDYSVVERYSSIIGDMPHLDVFDIPGQGLYLSSGFHRYEAHKLVNHTKIVCKVHAGSRQDAIDFADKANAKNPLQMSTLELTKLCERRLLMAPGADEKELSKMYGVSRAMIRDVKKKINWDGGAFPSFKEQESFDVIPSVDPRLKERHWSRLHFENARRSATLTERLIPCELCEYPISQRCHLLDVAAWGDNEFTRSYCVRCHEMFDLILKTIEADKVTRADILIKNFEGERLASEYKDWYHAIKNEAKDAAVWREFTINEREKQRIHYQKHRESIASLVSEAKEMGVR